MSEHANLPVRRSRRERLSRRLSTSWEDITRTVSLSWRGVGRRASTGWDSVTDRVSTSWGRVSDRASETWEEKSPDFDPEAWATKGRRVSLWVFAVAAGYSAAYGGTRAHAAPRVALDPIRGARLHVNAASTPARRAAEIRDERPYEARLLAHIAAYSQASWFGDWNGNVRRDVDASVDRARGDLPVLVAYNIPQRDCGQWSAGGAGDGDDYREWMRSFAKGIGDREAVVILEPDALAAMECLTPEARARRIELLRDAIDILKSESGASVYLDAGHPRWHDAEEMARRIQEVGGLLDGFALNVSNTHATELNIAYGEEISRLTGGLHFVIDTSRNGRGAPADGEWCNPRGRSLGVLPTTNTGHPLVDAYLWIKRPGESDGECNGGPAAGKWYEEYALELARNAVADGAKLGD